MEFILDGNIITTEDIKDYLMNNINHIYKALDNYKNNYDRTSLNELKMGKSGDWRIIEQNKNKSSSLAKFKAMGLNVANLLEDQYYGTIISNNVYVNVSFLTDFTPFKSRITARQCIDKIVNLRNSKSILIAGIKVTYVTDAKDDEPFVLYWYHTRDHYLVSLKKLNKLLKFRYNIA